MDWQYSSFHRYEIHGSLWLMRDCGKAFQEMRYAVLMKLMRGAIAPYNGSALSPKLDNIREQDIQIYEDGDRTWVAANSGRISTFSVRRNGKNWWKLDQGTEISNELRVVNDHRNHWLWEPSYSMPIDTYREALRSVGNIFYEVS